MAPPGFGDVALPTGARREALQWLGTQISRDRRFALAAVHNMYRGLTGQTALAPPEDLEDPNYDIDIVAFDAQREMFDAITDTFVDDDHNLKSAVRELVLSPYFRAVDLDAFGQTRSDELDSLGMARLLTPELLNRRLEAVLGYPWRASTNSTDYLLREYRIFYGGIDSNNVTRRIEAPNGLIGNIGLRMSAQMACRAVPHDFTEPMEERLLFPFVEPTYAPEDVNGFVIDEAVNGIRQNIVYLHQHLLGERLAPSDPEIEATYQLFYDTWQEGVAGIADDDETTVPNGTNLNWFCQANNDPWTGVELDEDERLRADPNYTVRAWMAVVSYLLADYRFLYQ